MHILTVLCKGGWMSKNLSEGWRRLGCSVEEFFYGTHMGKDWSTVGLETNHQLNVQLLKTAKRLKAEGRLDLIFAVIYDDVLEVETAQKLRALDVPMVNYHVDLLGQWYRILRTGKYFDRVACAQMDYWDSLRHARIRPYYMPMAANPSTPTNQSSTESISFNGVLYLGSPWTYRVRVLGDIAQQKIPLRIYGHNWQRHTPDPSQAQPYRKNLHDLHYYLLPRLQSEGWSRLWETFQNRLRSIPSINISTEIPSEYIGGSYANTDFASLVQGAAINLGFTHFLGTPETLTERRQVRLREFEIPMLGGFYITQDCTQLRELFQVGKHVVTWNNFSELIEKIRYYLNYPAEREKIAQASQTHCLEHHTWVHRFHQLLQELKIY